MNYTSPEKPQRQYMFSPHSSARSSGSTIEDEIDDTLSRLQIQSTKVEQWDIEQVAEWLNSVGFSSVAQQFVDQEITGDILLELNIDALKELGISTFGKRYKIMQAITALKENTTDVRSFSLFLNFRTPLIYPFTCFKSQNFTHRHHLLPMPLFRPAPSYIDRPVEPPVSSVDRAHNVRRRVMQMDSISFQERHLCLLQPVTVRVRSKPIPFYKNSSMISSDLSHLKV